MPAASEPSRYLHLGVERAVGGLGERLEVHERHLAVVDLDDRVLDAADVLGVRRRRVELPGRHAGGVGGDDFVRVVAGRQHHRRGPVAHAVGAGERVLRRVPGVELAGDADRRRRGAVEREDGAAGALRNDAAVAGGGDAAVVAAGRRRRPCRLPLRRGRSGRCRIRRPREGARENKTSFGTYRSSAGVVTRFRVSCQACVARCFDQRIRSSAARSSAASAKLSAAAVSRGAAAHDQRRQRHARGSDRAAPAAAASSSVTSTRSGTKRARDERGYVAIGEARRSISLHGMHHSALKKTSSGRCASPLRARPPPRRCANARRRRTARSTSARAGARADDEQRRQQRDASAPHPLTPPA